MHRKLLKEGKVGIGTISNVVCGASAIRMPYSETSKATIADSNAAVAVIRNAHRAEIPNLLQGSHDQIGPATLAQKIRDFSKSPMETLAKFKQLVEEIAGGSFSPENLRSWNTIETPVSACSCSGHTGERTNDSTSLAWLDEVAVRAFRSHHDLDPRRVLCLLRDDPKSPAERAMKLAGVLPKQNAEI